VPINFALTGPGLQYLVSDSEASVIIVVDEYVDTVESISSASTLEHVVASSQILDTVQTVLEDDHALADILTQDGWDTAEETDLAQLLYTSGTTSAPKGAMLTHRALLAHYHGTIPALDMTGRDNPLIAMPLYHSAALHVFVAPDLVLRATIRLPRVHDTPEIPQLSEDQQHGSLLLPPT